MSLYESVRAVTGASGDGPVDWSAVAAGARAATDPGSIDLSDADRTGYATDVRDARDRIRAVAGIDFDLPDTVEVLNRHHWLDANVETFERVMRPLDDRVEAVPAVGRVVNTGSMVVALSFLSNNVLGQYDPVLLAKDADDHALYFVHPNIVRIADALDVPFARFRRWIAFHELAHAAEFAAAPWLADHLESRLEEAVGSLTEGAIDRDSLGELDTAMTVVEGYAELVMDRAFDDEYADLRRKLDRRRRQRGPVARLVGRLLGLETKRRQYERGKAFFDTVADARGIAGATAVWDRPEALPTDEELDRPDLWLRRVPE
ncbi:MAG: zinc-dependent metalloprotease [Haloarculaceae archaeon]